MDILERSVASDSNKCVWALDTEPSMTSWVGWLSIFAQSQPRGPHLVKPGVCAVMSVWLVHIQRTRAVTSGDTQPPYFCLLRESKCVTRVADSGGVIMSCLLTLPPRSFWICYWKINDGHFTAARAPPRTTWGVCRHVCVIGAHKKNTFSNIGNTQPPYLCLYCKSYHRCVCFLCAMAKYVWALDVEPLVVVRWLSIFTQSLCWLLLSVWVRCKCVWTLDVEPLVMVGWLSIFVQSLPRSPPRTTWGVCRHVCVIGAHKRTRVVTSGIPNHRTSICLAEHLFGVYVCVCHA